MTPGDYTSVRLWLNQQAVLFRERGYLVEFQLPVASIRLRVEGGGLIGEILVWETMMADVYVAELENGSFLYENWGMKIGAKPLEDEFSAFLGYFTQVPTE